MKATEPWFATLARRAWWEVRFTWQAFLQHDFNDPPVQKLIEERFPEAANSQEKP